MTATIYIESQHIAEELYALIKTLESSRWRTELDTVEEKLSHLSARLRAAVDSLEAEFKENATMASLRERLQALSTAVREALPQTETATQLHKEWKSRRKRLIDAYEELAKSLKLQDIHVPHLRPTNYARNIFHISSGVSVLLLIQFVTPHIGRVGLTILAAAYTLLAWTLEVTRRIWPGWNTILLKGLGKIAHPHEHYRVNSATWFGTALLLISLTHNLLACSLAAVILGISDPAAAFIGRKYGRHKIYAGRSLEGSLAFVASGMFISMLVMFLFYGQLSVLSMLAIAAAASVTGAIVELYSQRIDDNLSIPISVCMGTILMMYFLSIPGTL